MSRKYEEIRRIAGNAIKCWLITDGEGATLSLDDIIGRCRKESVQIARTLAVCQILSSGFPVSDIADFLDRTPQAIRDMRSTGKYLRDAQANLWAGKLDSGLTYSNMERHETVMVIAKASEGAEYWNSIDHEKNHLLQHIALTYEIDPYGEEISYISGELIRDIYRMAKGLLCDCCRKRRLQIL